jgi:hypothetical protein
MKNKIIWTIGIAIFLFLLLMIGGWALMLGIGLLLLLAYRRNRNAGLLWAASVFIGLGIGLGIELILSREGGVAIMTGLGLAYLGLTLFIWLEKHQLQWLSLIFSLSFFVLTGVLWSYSLADLSLYLSIFPFAILGLLIFAVFLYWRERSSKRLVSKL